jgi:HEAT repeat protein
MRCRLAGLPLVCLSLLCAAPALRAEDEDVAADKAALKSAGVATDGPGLLAFFKKRTLGEKERAKIATLIEQLGSDDFDEREKAEEALIEFGAGARRPLQDALKKSRDLELRKRAERCLAGIGKNSAADVLAAAARLLAHQKPAGSVAALLDYVPSADEREVMEEVVRALGKTGVRDGKADEALVKALKDKLAARRAAAGEVLARVGGGTHLEAVRKLLKDDDTLVRQRVGVALFDSRDRRAVPVLIALLTQVSGEDRDEVEERLAQLAGEKAPAPPADGSAEARAKYKAAWEKWWKDAGAKVDLAKVELNPPVRGYTIVAMVTMAGGKRGWAQAGKVVELDKSGKVRWEIKDLYYPTFAQVVGHDRVLITEWNGRVSERTFKGAIKWQKTLPGQARGAQRLRNGHTFVYTRNELVELDRTGKEVRKLTRPAYDVIAAHREKDGKISLLSTNGRFLRLDSSGKELKSFTLTGVYANVGTNMHVLPRGRVLVPQQATGKVVEYDSSGKEVWSASAQYPNSVRRLPNGQTLVTNSNTRRVFLLDKKGKEVWGKTMEGYVYYADRR